MSSSNGALGGAAPHLLLEGLGDAVIAAAEDGIIAYANPAVGRILGWNPRELVGEPLTTIIPEGLREEHRKGFARYLETRRPNLIGTAVTVPAQHADGSLREIELTLNAIPVDGGELFVAALRDLTDRQEAARQRNLAGYLRAVAELAVALGLSGEVRSFDEASPTVLRILGEALGWEVGDVWLVQPDGSVCCEAVWCASERHQAFAERSATMSFPAGVGLPGRVAAAGQPIWLQDVTTDENFPRAGEAAALGLHGAFGFPVTGGGEVIGVISFFTGDVAPPDDDLIEVMTVVGRALGEFVVREREEAAARFRSALLAAEAEAIIDGIIVVGQDGSLLSWNDRFLKMTGTSPRMLRDEGIEGLLRTADELVLEHDELVALAVEVVNDADAVVRREFTLADGRAIDLYTAPLRDGTLDYGRGFYVRDITEQKRTEQRYAALARTLQASLLPPRDPELPGLEVAARYSPAEAGADVGGDFYDVFPFTGATWGFAIGDVCGRGVAAASLTALARYTLRAVALRARRPSRMLAALNSAVVQDEGMERFLTVIVGRTRVHADHADVTFACGGHPLPLVVRADGRTEWAGQSGTLIGVFDEIDATDVTVDLRPGDSIVFYTDGVTEARSKRGPMLGSSGLEAALAGSVDKTAAELADVVCDAVVAAIDGESSDDVAVFVVRMPS